MNTFTARFPELASSLAAELEMAGNRALADELRVATVRAASLDQGKDVAYISLEPLRQLSDVERSIIGERYRRIVPAGGDGATYLDLDNLGRIVGVQIFSPMPELQAAIRARAVSVGAAARVAPSTDHGDGRWLGSLANLENLWRRAPLNRDVRPQSAMREYLGSKWVRVGLALLVIGATPLLFIIAAAAVGLWPDPNPNPVGPGLLFGLTFWPAVICIVVGVIRVRNRGAA
jgi:hypothetical protein